ncbi:unnamed protein product [Linum trigynum]|uniref:Uncharacterized protein n=1 Tax=Linum trigynum TaxID=586398 RepID=A0AAV2G0L3_9ROSI
MALGRDFCNAALTSCSTATKDIQELLLASAGVVAKAGREDLSPHVLPKLDVKTEDLSLSTCVSFITLTESTVKDYVTRAFAINKIIAFAAMLLVVIFLPTMMANDLSGRDNLLKFGSTNNIGRRVRSWSHNDRLPFTWPEVELGLSTKPYFFSNKLSQNAFKAQLSLIQQHRMNSFELRT